MKTLKDNFKDKKEQMKIHLEEFGKGKNRDIDGREKFIMTIILPVIEKDVIKAVKEFEEQSLSQKAYNEKSAYWTGWNDCVVQLLAIHEKVFGEFDDVEQDKEVKDE